MKNLNFILVCLDDTPLDDHIIRYANMMARLISAQKVHFIHAVQKNVDSSAKKRVQENVSKIYTYPSETGIHIVPGNNAQAVLSWPDFKTVDLLIMGIKPKTESTGEYASKVIDGTQCSMLLVPTTSINELSSILIPIDFSKKNISVLEIAAKIQKEQALQVILQHVFYVPLGFSSTGKSYEEFSAIMLKNRQKEYEQFKRQNQIDDSQFEVVFTLDNDDRPSDNIYELAKERKVSMIALSSVGRTKLASLVVKSKAVSLLKYDQDIPCLVVKNKEESMGFLEAVMKI